VQAAPGTLGGVRAVRRRPYTWLGLRRMRCERAGCTNRARHQWQICADGRRFRRICLECDIALNRLVLEFMGWDGVEAVMADYEREARRA
jgi:hypothetical protein